MWFYFISILIGLLIVSGARMKYKQLDEKIEKMSKLLHLIAVKLNATSATMLPFIIFAMDYATGDVTDESYYLPFRAMWVLYSLFA